MHSKCSELLLMKKKMFYKAFCQYPHGQLFWPGLVNFYIHFTIHYTMEQYSHHPPQRLKLEYVHLSPLPLRYSPNCLPISLSRLPRVHLKMTFSSLLLTIMLQPSNYFCLMRIHDNNTMNVAYYLFIYTCSSLYGR